MNFTEYQIKKLENENISLHKQIEENKKKINDLNSIKLIHSIDVKRQCSSDSDSSTPCE